MGQSSDEGAYENYVPAERPEPDHPAPYGKEHVPAVPQPSAVPAVRAHALLHGVAYEPFLVASTICTAIYLMTDAGGYFWPMWVMLGTGIPLLLSLVRKLP
jgi:hypothetical protein